MGVEVLKLSYLIPDNQYSFFEQIIPYLEKQEIIVEINNHNSKDIDLFLAAILPITHQWIGVLERTHKPFILWHWDLYSFVDFTQPRWRCFLELLPKAIDIWSCGYETARQLKEIRNLDSYMMPAWIDPTEFSNPIPISPLVFYAAGSCAFGKRTEWLKKACELLQLPCVINCNQTLDRANYVRTIKCCQIYAMTAFEESNATIPAMEAAVAGRPVVISDLPSSREVFGRHAYYFKSWDFDDLCRQIRRAWVEDSTKQVEFARKRVVERFGIEYISQRIAKRLKELYANF